ncbi:MAG: hypothetical protein JWQ24_5578 [Tardiphaga sp.]|nr:hypothetical protein [Tardiphaga sp.]
MLECHGNTLAGSSPVAVESRCALAPPARRREATADGRFGEGRAKYARPFEPAPLGTAQAAQAAYFSPPGKKEATRGWLLFFFPGGEGDSPSSAETRTSIGIAPIRSLPYPQPCPLVGCIENFRADLQIHVATRRVSLAFCLRFAAALGGDSSRRTIPLRPAVALASHGSALTIAAAPRTRWSVHPHGRPHCQAVGSRSGPAARKSRQGCACAICARGRCSGFALLRAQRERPAGQAVFAKRKHGLLLAGDARCTTIFGMLQLPISSVKRR